MYLGAIGSSAIVGVLPIFVLFLVPLVKISEGKKVINHSLLKVLLAFAVGGLLGTLPSSLAFFFHGLLRPFRKNKIIY